MTDYIRCFYMYKALELSPQTLRQTLSEECPRQELLQALGESRFFSLPLLQHTDRKYAL